MDYLRILDALEFAKEAHEGQPRKGTDIPYIVHPLEVADIVRTMTDDEEIIMAALLHDVMEDAKVPCKLLERRFGKRVAELVAAESENKRENLPEEDSWEIRKRETIGHLKRAPLDVQMIALGDKLANARAICRDFDAIGEDLWYRFNAPPEKIAWYYGAVRDVLWEELSKTGAWCELDDLMSHDAFFLREERTYSSDWEEILDTALKVYSKFNGTDEDERDKALKGIFGCLRDCARNDAEVMLEAEFGGDDGEPISLATLLFKGDTETSFLSMVTYPGETTEFFTTVKFRKVIEWVTTEKKFDGIVINVRSDSFTVPAEILEYLAKMYEDDGTDGGEFSERKRIEGNSVVFETSRPVSDACFSGILDELHALTDAEKSVRVQFENLIEDDEIMEISAEKDDGGLYRMKITYNMSDFEQEPLVLGRDGFRFGEIAELFRYIALECVPTDEIEEIEDFRNIS